MHYYLSWRLEYLRQDYINTLLRMTPLFFEVLKYALLSKGKSRNPNFTIWRKLEKGQRISEKDIIEIDPSLTKGNSYSWARSLFNVISFD